MVVRNLQISNIIEAYEQTVLWWQKKNIKTDYELAEAFNGHVIAFAYHSGNIENPNITYHDTREIFEHDGVTAYTGDLRTLYEIRNAKYANQYFFDAFKVQQPLNETFIKEMQKRLTLNTYDERRWQNGERPGEYKKGNYVTGKNETGALAEDVPVEMSELIDDLKNVPNDKSLIGAAFLHAKFENIHPFADGNGRTGRLVMNYFLVTHNHPPIVIHQEDRQKYFAALEAWDNEQDLEPLKNFLKWQTVKTWEKQLQKEQSNTNTTIEKKIKLKELLTDK